jgi:hypothetical protein
MKVLRVAAMMALVLAGPVYAQRPSAPTASDPPKSQIQIDGEKSTERAYKNSLSNIPDQPPADPWGGARATEAPKSASTPPQAKRTKASARSTN